MPNYTTLLIPASLPKESVTLLAEKLRNFKLHALLSDPAAFSQSHAAESLLPFSAWEARIANSDFRIVVCVVDNHGKENGVLSGDEIVERDGNDSKGGEAAIMERLVEAEWAGTFTLVGPVTREDWLYSQSGQPTPAADGEETRWHLTSLFVLPEHRGRGLAVKLTLAAIQAGSSSSATSDEAARQEGDGQLGPTRFRLIVHPKNKPVVGLYEKLGFVVGGAYTQREAMMAMGDAAGIPLNAEADVWDARTAIGMECMV